jgi:hypothetical protein
LDNQISVSTHWGGLAAFQVPEEEASRKNPRLWPCLQVSPDQGSDGLCALNCLARAKGVNVDVAFDPSHGCHRDVIAIIKQADLWQHELLIMLSWNARHGPWMSKARAEQVTSCMKEFFALMTPDSCELFQAMLRPMLRDRCEEDCITDADINEKTWTRLMELDGIMHNKGEHISLNRFMGMLSEGRRQDAR